MTTRSLVRGGLVGALPANIVDELLDAYEEAKKNFYLGGHRLSEVEGGRFCEAAFRLLQSETGIPMTAVGRQLDTDRLIAQLSMLPRSQSPDSVRLHIPRALRLVYDVRNSRDAAHLADGIDPNLQDSTVVVAVLDWVLAEFVRLHHGVTSHEAQALVEQLVTRAVPAIQEFGDFKKVLRPNLAAGDHLLLLLYATEPNGATVAQLEEWSPKKMRANLRRTLSRLQTSTWIHTESGGRVRITRSGMREVEARRLFEIT